MQEKTLSREIHFRGKLLQLEVAEVELPNGARTQREFIHHPGAVCAAVLTRDQEWVLVRQFRYAANQILLEVPAGKIDGTEGPDATILRELREEIGFRHGKLERLMEFWATPGFCDERMTCYLVSEAELDEPEPDEDEFLEVLHVPLAEGIAMALDGRLSDAKSIATVLAAARRLGV